MGRLPVLVLPLLMAGALAARAELRFEHLSLDEGLSQVSVQALAQDRRGFLWVGTADGLNRYDGYEFKVYRNDPEDPGSLSDNHVTALHEDRAGTLWVGSADGGLNRFDPSTDRFTRYRNEPRDPTSLSGNWIRSIWEDGAGRLWIGTWGAGLNRFDATTGRFTRYRSDPADPASLSDDWVLALHGDSAGALWVGTRRGGLNRLDPAGERFTRFVGDPEDGRSLSAGAVFAIHEDEAGGLWVGTGGGLSRFDAATGTFVRYLHDPEDPESLGGDFLMAIEDDGAGGLWIGSEGGGLSRFDPATEKFDRYAHSPADPRSPSSNAVVSMLVDDSGVLWVGTRDGGLDKHDPSTERFARYHHEADDPGSLSHDSVWSILEDDEGRLWVGTAGGGLNRLDPGAGGFRRYVYDPAEPASLSSSTVATIYQDRAGTIWIGTTGGGLDRYQPSTDRFENYRYESDDENSLSSNFVQAIYEDREGVLWVGTNGGGLNKLDATTGRFTSYRHDPAGPESLSHDSITSIREDAAGVLWVGTFDGLNSFDRAAERFTRYRHDPDDPRSLSSRFVLAIHEDGSGVLWVGTTKGLARLDPRTGRFRTYTQEDGLPNDAIYGILEDEQGYLWLSTNRGLSRLRAETETFRNWDARDGLQSNEFNQGAYFASRSGRLYFGGVGGLVAFSPAELEDNPHVPPVAFTSFKKYNREVPLATPIWELAELELSYRDDGISFELAALDFRAPDKNRYAYRLAGSSDEWVELGETRDVTFIDLDGGSYVLQVRGSNNDGVWNEAGASLRLRVQPPWWGLAWVQLLGLLLAALLVWSGHRWRTRRIEEQNRLLESRVRERTAELRASQAELVKKERLAVLGQLTATVSHELRNPLAAMKPSLYLVRRAIGPEDSRQEAAVRRIERGVDRCDRLVDELLDFTRVGTLELRPVVVDEWLAEVLKELDEPRDVAVRPDLALGDRVADVDPERLRRAVVNVFENACQALAEKQAAAPESFQARLEVSTRELADRIEIAFADNGPGIAEEELPRLFEPLYSSKTFGLGLGLTIVRRILRQHGGGVEIDSRPPDGTRVVLWLPSAQAMPVARARSPHYPNGEAPSAPDRLG